ncbi:MAG: hypothetical protein ACOZNI_23650 [Myxococcota bacterium]
MGSPGRIATIAVVAGAGCAGDPARDCPDDTVAVSDAHTYSLRAELALGSADVAAGEDVTVTFADVTRDLRGAPLDVASDVVAVALVRFPSLTADEVEHALAHDEVLMSDVGDYRVVETGGRSSVRLSEASYLGNPFDVSDLAEGSGTWLVTLNGGLEPAEDVRQLAAIVPRSDATGHELDVAAAATTLALDVELEALAPLVLPAEGTVTLDLTGLTRDGLGDPFDPEDVEEVWLARFAETELSALEAGFVTLEDTAEALWKQPHDGAATVVLDALRSAGGDAFVGYSGEGLWLLALVCPSCTNPSPEILTVVEPCAPEGA